jgi:ATP-dependent exoDNAse (exonuclease V) beta subunit
LREYADWKGQRAEVLERGSRMKFDLFTASDAPTNPAGFACEVEVVETAKGEQRPAGRRFGSLVHQILRDIALDGGEGSAMALARMHARLLGAPLEEADAAAEAVTAVLRHPVFDRARRAERCHREWPVLLKLEEGRMLEGVIDLAFQEQGTWVIVDFKSDADLKVRQEHYHRQLQWYGLALTRTTGLPVRAVLLGV